MIKTRLLLFLLLFNPGFIFAQNIKEKLSKGIAQLLSDSQMQHAVLGFYVMDSKTGKAIIEKNAQMGLAPASCQKVITACSAFEFLGKGFRYETKFGFRRQNPTGSMGTFYIRPSLDPSLGSWRYEGAKPDSVLKEITQSFMKTRTDFIFSGIEIDNAGYESQGIPDGWIWQDIGNYYGAGCYSLNWRENQRSVFLKSGNNIGDSVKIVGYAPEDFSTDYFNELRSAVPGSGDNAYYYFTPASPRGYFRGTIPVKQDRFEISISIPDPATCFYQELKKVKLSNLNFANADSGTITPQTPQIICTHYSPTLDSLIYWFLKKSINLYGEALLKTCAYKKTGEGSTEKGIELIQQFWEQNGIASSAINIMDGSGLSPQNRVTPYSLVRVLQFAKTRAWFNSFYDALPEINGIKMKSGSIGGARSYTGYIKSKSGGEYIFAIIINNYAGSSEDIVRKMWRLLDMMK